MQLGPSGWQLVGAGAVLLAAGVVADRPLAVVGAAGIAGLGVALQASVLLAARRARRTLEIAIEPATIRTTAGSTAEVDLCADLRAIDADLAVDIDAPAGLTVTPDRLAVDAGDPERTATATIEAADAGTYTVETATATVSDPLGTVAVSFAHPLEATVTVTAADARVAGDGRAPGHHPGGEGRGSIEPGRVRPYVPGDPVSRIDWTTSARHDDRFVREQSASGHSTVIVLDRRTVPGHEADFRARREAALEAIAGASGANERLAVVLVDGTEHRLLESGRSAIATTVRRTRPIERANWPRDPGRPLADRSLGATETDFDRALAPFADPGPVADPLAAAIASVATDGRSHVVVLTEDVDPRPIRKAVRTADARGHRTTVALTPVREDDRLRADLDRLANVSCAWIDPAVDRATVGDRR